MLLKRKDENGNTFYVSAFTGKVQKLQRETGRHERKLPNYVYGSFRKPAMSIAEKMALRKF